jgi:hypothetical protein
MRLFSARFGVYFFSPEFSPEFLGVFQPTPPDFGTENFIHYTWISQTEPSLFFGLAELVPADKCYLLLFGKALPEEVPLHAFDGCKYELWGCQSGKDIDREGLEDRFEQNEPAGEI